MNAASSDERQRHTRERTQRDLERLSRRNAKSSFWRSLALIGSVGWPIVLLTTGGGVLGHYLDSRFGTGARFTLLLLTLAAALGSYSAYRSLRGRAP